MTVGDKIREARKRQGKSADWLAKEVGCSQSSISQFERGFRNPSARMLMLISKALNCRVADLTTAEYIRAENATGGWDIFAPWEPNNTISEDEQMRFAITFEKLNSEGRRRVFEFMEDLAEISRYRIDFGELKEETSCPEGAPQTAAECSPASDQTDAGNADTRRV